MQYAFKPDYEQVKARYDAFWHQQILDRPPVSISLPKDPKGARVPFPPASKMRKSYASERERWLDFDERVHYALAYMENTNYLFDALPVFSGQLGPSQFSGFCGCGYEFLDNSPWAHPVIKDWERDAQAVRFDPQNELFKAALTFQEKLIKAAQGKFIVAMYTLSSGADHIAAARGAIELSFDLLECPDQVHAMMERCEDELFECYGLLSKNLLQAGMPLSAWAPAVPDSGTLFVAQNDFSCMISPAMFDEFFLPGIVKECKHFDRTIYHLDGPGAIRHLDSLLQIRELDCIQWVCGAGNEGYHKWASLYQRIQKAGKSIQIMCDVKELPLVFETLRPEGLWFSHITGINDEETANEAVRRITAWK